VNLSTAIERFAETARRCGCTFSLEAPDEIFAEASISIPHSQWIDQGTANQLALEMALAMKEAAKSDELPSELFVIDLVVEGQIETARHRKLFGGLVALTIANTDIQIKHAYNPEGKPLVLDNLKVPQLDNYDRITLKVERRAVQ